MLRSKLGVARRRQIPAAYRVLTGEDPYSLPPRRAPVRSGAADGGARGPPTPPRAHFSRRGAWSRLPTHADGREPRKPTIRAAQDHRAPTADSGARPVARRGSGCSWRRPGYGKTTLAEQWAPQRRPRRRRGSGRGARPRTSPCWRAMAVAAADDRARVRAAASRAAGGHAGPRARGDRVLAEMLAEDLAAGPRRAGSSIDDYQHLAASAAVRGVRRDDRRASPVQILIASRVRPALGRGPQHPLRGGARDRRRALLAMSAEEVEEVLAERATS